MTENREARGDEHLRKAEMDDCLESVGWGVLLVVIGTIWLMPEKILPPGSWLIAAGLIILGLNAIRWLKGIRVRGFGMVVGIVALFAGLRALFDVDLPLFPVALIVIGVWMLAQRLAGRSTARRSWNCCGQD